MRSADHARYKGAIETPVNPMHEYQYRTMSVAHFAELREDVDHVRRAGMMSDSKTFQEYLSEIKFELPENFKYARFVIVVATLSKPMIVNFRFNGRRRSAAMSPGYYETGLTQEALLNEVKEKIVAQEGCRVEKASDALHLKLLAVRSGLGEYGRNNICYVHGMGSFIALHAFLTDRVFKEDHWGEMRMMDLCKDCSVCAKRCPLGAIRTDRFVIDVNRCVTLYNEVDGVFPDWIPSNAHSAVFGCVRCQFSCPANREPLKQIGRLEDLTEEETRQFMSGTPEERVVLSVSRKLKIPYIVKHKETVKIVGRNIKALVDS